jgi:hypothetical protein
MVRRKVRLTGHAVGIPPVIRFPSGYEHLGRISTSFSYREKGTLNMAVGPQYCGSERNIHTMERGL